MGRKVKCQVTKEVGDSDVFYRASNGKYYKTEDIYKKWWSESCDRKECIRLICDYADYKSGEYAPTFLNKMLKDFGERVGYDILLETIKECEEEFQWANENKDFKNEMMRLFYYKAIIGNHITDVYKRNQIIKEQQAKIDIVPSDVFENLDKIGCPVGGGKDLRDLLGEI